MTAALHVDVIPIHPAEYPASERHRVNGGVSCLTKLLQQQGFAEIVADLPGRMIGLLIDTARLVDRIVPSPNQRHQGRYAGDGPASNRPNDVPADTG